MKLARLSTAQLKSLRAHWADQAEFELVKPSRRALKAIDVVAAFDELLELRRDQSLRDLLATQLEAREALGRILDACSEHPTELACAELVALRGDGWQLQCRVDNDGVTFLRAIAPKTESA